MEKSWGIPHDSFESFLKHTINGAWELNSQYGGPDHVWDADLVTFSKASAALLILRNKTRLTENELVKLCWLECGLLEQIVLDFTYTEGGVEGVTRERLDTFYPGLINDAQMLLVREWVSQAVLEDEAARKTLDEPHMTEEELERSVQMTMRRIKAAQRSAATDAADAAERRLHLREFLSNVT